MRQTTITGHYEVGYPVAEMLWISTGVILLLAFGDSLALRALALAIAAIAAAWWIRRNRMGSKRHPIGMVKTIVAAAAVVLTAAFTLVTPAQAASINTSSFDICSALRSGTSLATIESALEARGYSATNAGALTGTTIRQHCPDEAAGVMAQIARQHG